MAKQDYYATLGIERGAAASYIERYFARYPLVKKYMDDTRAQAKERGYVETVFGRRLWLPEINSQTVLGHFGLDAEAQRLHFRYVQALPRDEVITAEAVEDVLTLVTYSPLLYADALEGLANGSLTLAEARAQVQARLGGT